MLKLGSSFIVAFDGLDLNPELAKQLRELNPAGVILFAQNIQSKEQVIKLNSELKDLLGEDLLISVDQEGGRVQRLGAITSPLLSLREAAKLGKDSLLAEARVLCTELKELGFNYNFAPCADLDTNPANPIIGERSLGSNPRLVSEQVSLLIHEYKRQGILTCAKHFPGHGDSDLDSHLDLPVLDYAAKYGASAMQEYDKHLAPFRASIEATVDSIMIAHLLVPHVDPELPCSLSSKAIQIELRTKLAYEGLIISDELSMKALSRFGNHKDVCKQALIAGNDLIIWNIPLEEVLSIARELEANLIKEESRARVAELKKKISR